jgi:hypothetical protein
MPRCIPTLRLAGPDGVQQCTTDTKLIRWANSFQLRGYLIFSITSRLGFTALGL